MLPGDEGRATRHCEIENAVLIEVRCDDGGRVGLLIREGEIVAEDGCDRATRAPQKYGQILIITHVCEIGNAVLVEISGRHGSDVRE